MGTQSIVRPVYSHSSMIVLSIRLIKDEYDVERSTIKDECATAISEFYAIRYDPCQKLYTPL